MVSASAIVVGAQDVIVTPEQDTVIHQYAKRKPPESVSSVPAIELNIGSSVPDTVELLVDPATRRIFKVYD